MVTTKSNQTTLEVDVRTQTEYMNELNFDEQIEAVYRTQEYAIFEAMSIIKNDLRRREGLLE